FVDGGVRQVQGSKRRLDVVDRDIDCGRIADGVVLRSEERREGIECGSGVVVQVLVRGGWDIEQARCQVESPVRRAVTPLDGDGVAVKRAGVREGAAECGAAVFVDGGVRQVQGNNRRLDVVDRDIDCGRIADGVVL